jgi:hypothetical protein
MQTRAMELKLPTYEKSIVKSIRDVAVHVDKDMFLIYPLSITHNSLESSFEWAGASFNSVVCFANCLG